MSQRKVNIMNCRTNINSTDAMQLINTNSDDLKAIQQQQDMIRNNNENREGSSMNVPLVKDNNDVNRNYQCDNGNGMIMGNTYGGYYNSPYGNGLYNGYSNYGMGIGMGMNYMGRSDTFFDKLFITFERANYQMYHLCEMIKMIQNQTPTIKYFSHLLIKGYYYLLDKTRDVLEQTKLLYHFFSQMLSFRLPTTNSDTLLKEINAIDFLLKATIITCLTGLVVKLYSR